MNWRRIGIAAALAGGTAGCAPVSPPLAPGPVVEVKPGGCEPLRDADFEGAGAQRLRDYLSWIAQSRGAVVGVTAQDVSLVILRGPPRPGPSGVQVAEVSCTGSGGDGPYRVALYRDALSGRPQAVVYETLAHEFHHIVQIRRDQLPCQAHGSAWPLEVEARAVAATLVPSCSR